MVVSVEDFGRFFLAHRNGTYKCVLCSHETFAANVAEKDIQSFYSLPGAVGDGVAPNSALDFYSFACTNCGKLDFIYGPAVREWLAKNPAPPPETKADNAG